MLQPVSLVANPDPPAMIVILVTLARCDVIGIIW